MRTPPQVQESEEQRAQRADREHFHVAVAPAHQAARAEPSVMIRPPIQQEQRPPLRDVLGGRLLRVRQAQATFGRRRIAENSLPPPPQRDAPRH